MGRDSLLERHERFIAAAVLTAQHLNQKGFRQIDVRRLLDRWVYSQNLIDDHSIMNLQNTQIARYLTVLVKEGNARRVGTGKQPLYRLTRPGLLEIVTRFVGRPLHERRDHFFFLYFFVRTYRGQLVKLVEREGKYFPPSLNAQLNSLLDSDLLLLGQINSVKQELAKMESRLEEQKDILKIAERSFASGQDYMEVVKALDKRYPYGMNPLRQHEELLEEGTDQQRAWEITLGTASRLSYLWSPARRMLIHYLHELETLKAAGEKEFAALTSRFKAK